MRWWRPASCRPFLSEGTVAQVAAYLPGKALDISDFPTRHNYGLGLWQNHIERILAGWVGELAVTIYRGREVTGFAQDDTGVDVELADGQSLLAGDRGPQWTQKAWAGPGSRRTDASRRRAWVPRQGDHALDYLESDESRETRRRVLDLKAP
jgi:FAD binding domain-containing protein